MLLVFQPSCDFLVDTIINHFGCGNNLDSSMRCSIICTRRLPITECYIKRRNDQERSCFQRWLSPAATSNGSRGVSIFQCTDQYDASSDMLSVLTTKPFCSTDQPPIAIARCRGWSVQTYLGDFLTKAPRRHGHRPRIYQRLDNHT